jgi:hypothetical protein
MMDLDSFLVSLYVLVDDWWKAKHSSEPPSARSGSIFGNGQVLVMRTVEDQAYSLSQLVSSEQSVRLYNLALAMDPLGLHRVEPRALFGQKAAYDPHSLATVFDLTVVRGDPLCDLFADVPGSVLPDQHPNPFARRLKPLAAPPKEAGAYGALTGLPSTKRTHTFSNSGT